VFFAEIIIIIIMLFSTLLRKITFGNSDKTTRYSCNNCLRSFADHIHKQTLQFLENCLLLLLRIEDDDLRGQEIKVLR
jgi:hypothetical protein